MPQFDLDYNRLMLDEELFEMEREDILKNNVERRGIIGVLSAFSESLKRKQ